MESLIPNPTNQNATKTGYFSEQTKLNKTKVCDSRPEIIHFAWLIWTRSFQITWNQNHCLHTYFHYVRKLKTGNCGGSVNIL